MACNERDQAAKIMRPHHRRLAADRGAACQRKNRGDAESGQTWSSATRGLDQRPRSGQISWRRLGRPAASKSTARPSGQTASPCRRSPIRAPSARASRPPNPVARRAVLVVNAAPQDGAAREAAEAGRDSYGMEASPASVPQRAVFDPARSSTAS